MHVSAAQTRSATARRRESSIIMTTIQGNITLYYFRKIFFVQLRIDQKL